jgi:hypothetical protein
MIRLHGIVATLGDGAAGHARCRAESAQDWRDFQ